MSESEHDDLADALARMAQGDVAPSEREHEPITPPLQPNRPVAAKPTAARAPAPTPRPPRPAAPALGTPSPPPSSAPSPRPAAPAPRPTAPVPRTSGPASPAAAAPLRKPRPTAPTIRQATASPTDAEVDGGQSTGLSAGAENTSVIEDDDSVIVPAPEASVFMPGLKNASSAGARAAIARKKNLNFRRTLIPILLTSGTMMLVFGCLKSFSGPDSMFASLASWIPMVLFIAGSILLALAVINMLSVKAQRDADRV